MRPFLLFLLVHCNLLVLSQSIDVDSLSALRNKALNGKTNEDIQQWNDRFNRLLLKVINEEVSLTGQLDSIPYFGLLKAPDGQFTLYNWNVVYKDETYRYYAIIKSRDGAIISLFDNSEKTTNPELKTLTPNEWYGALYYEIIRVKDRPVDYYVLLGWDGNDAHTTKKIIDVLYFDEDGSDGVVFGKQVFLGKNGAKNRVIFEFSSRAVMSLKYHGDRDMIIFDHLVPFERGAEGFYEFYGPDLSYDAFELKKGEWHFQENIEVRGEKSGKKYIDPPEIDRRR